MKQLKFDEIESIITTLDKIRNYKHNVCPDWSDFLFTESQYLLKVEIIAIWKLCLENGIDLDFGSLPEICPTEEDDDFYDDAYEYFYSLEDVLEPFVFPSDMFMKKKGWEVIHVDVGLEIDVKDRNDDEEVRKSVIAYCKKVYGEYTNKLLGFINCMCMVYIEEFYVYMPTLLRSERAGRYLSYAEKHPHIKKTKQYNMICFCLEAIINPFEVYYPDLSDDVIGDDGCLYSFSTGGDFPDNGGEMVSIVHCKVYRYFCIELADQLLTMAEKQYKL